MLRICRKHVAKNLRKAHAVKSNIQNTPKKITATNRKTRRVMTIAALIAQPVTAL